MFKELHTHPFYRPLWIRLAIVLSTAFWVAFELHAGGNGLWLALASAVCVYVIYALLITYPAQPPPEK